ncbi:MAG: IPT/TIG domain-containing protein, partial [Planctomycetes bacterium]|nr:IPT/TIG domain-containing protein [Planctomycetota bacterium]
EASFTYCRSGEEGCYSPEPIGPYIFSHSPRSGPAGGGTLMTVIGENFTRGTYALVCGQPLEDQLVELNVHEYEGQADRITGYTPPGCGTCEIEVVNLFGSDQRAQAFVYLPPSIVELGVIGAPDYPFIDPAGEGEIHLQLANYTVTTEVRLCGQPLAPTSVTGVGGIDTDFIADIPPGTHGTTCDLEVVEPASGCDPDTRPAFITYAAPGIPMLLLGVFSGADDPNDPISGDSILQEALVDSGFSPAEIEYPPDGSITLELLQRYEVVVFSDVENGSNDKGEKRDRDWLTEIEIVHLQQYAMDGGILLLLGQLDPPQGDIKAQDSSDRNEVARPFGIQFQRDVFVDEVNHIFYDGCAGAVACGAEPSQPTQGGDQDYGTEYPIIRLEDGILDKYRLLAPLFAGVDTAFLNWGQTLTVSASSYQVVALMRGTRGRSWGDADPLYKETSCRDDHLVTHFDGGEIDHYDAAGMIGVAASIVPRDGLSGIVLAFGDQDQFWNFYLGHPGSGGDYYCPGGDCCFGELKFSSLRFIQNLADFVRSR